MADPKGDHLYVNLSASQTRQRLKGFGHGVRKIQSAGKNRSLLIHTAMGEHLTELEDLFADVGHSVDESGLSEPIENLRNIGKTSAAWLREAGICTVVDLQDVGPVFAFMQVKQIYPRVNANLLWALAAGLSDRDWRDLNEAEKRQLLAEIE